MTTRPIVRISTPLGDIRVELFDGHAPITAGNFLELVRAGAYDGGEFHRTVRLDNNANDEIGDATIGRGLQGETARTRMPDDRYPIVVVQASAGPTLPARQPIPLERTSDTGLQHIAGTISMSRQEPDSAVSDFFFCLRDEPELDFGGRRNTDGQGFAAFGRVVSGMSVLQAIHGSPSVGQSLEPPIPIATVTVDTV
jgi:peptidyl-prolyl cis-trans isomerase A (cyclophilin A)